MSLHGYYYSKIVLCLWWYSQLSTGNMGIVKERWHAIKVPTFKPVTHMVDHYTHQCISSFPSVSLDSDMSDKNKNLPTAGLINKFNVFNLFKDAQISIMHHLLYELRATSTCSCKRICKMCCKLLKCLNNPG